RRHRFRQAAQAHRGGGRRSRRERLRRHHHRRLAAFHQARLRQRHRGRPEIIGKGESAGLRRHHRRSRGAEAPRHQEGRRRDAARGRAQSKNEKIPRSFRLRRAEDRGLRHPEEFRDRRALRARGLQDRQEIIRESARGGRRLRPLPALADDRRCRAARKRDQKTRRHELPGVHLVRAGDRAREGEDRGIWEVDGDVGRVRTRRCRSMRVATYAIALIVLATAATVAAQSVTVEGGNIFYRGGNGTRHQLTFSGLDSDVILSPDGKLVAFVRRTPDKLISTSMGDEEATEIWIINIDGKAARRLLTGTSAKEPQRSLANFRNLQFSPDGARIYFLSAGWVTSNAIYAVNRLTAKASFIAPGNSLEVIQRGTYAG